MYKSHVAELVIVMADKKNEKLAEMALQALAAVSKADPSCAPDDRYASFRNDRPLLDVMLGGPQNAPSRWSCRVHHDKPSSQRAS